MKAPTKSIDTFILFFNLADWRWARHKPPGANKGLPPPSELPSFLKGDTQTPTVSLVSSTRSAEIHPPSNPQTCVSNGIKTNLKVTPRSAKSSAKWKLLKRSLERQVTNGCLEEYCRELCSCSISLALRGGELRSSVLRRARGKPQTVSGPMSSCVVSVTPAKNTGTKGTERVPPRCLLNIRN